MHMYTVTELSVYMSFVISKYTSSIPCSYNAANIAWVIVLSDMNSRNPRTQRRVVCCIRGTSRKYVYGMDVIYHIYLLVLYFDCHLLSSPTYSYYDFSEQFVDI